MSNQLSDLLTLLKFLNPSNAPSPVNESQFGIVIADRGFIWVGDVTDEGENLRVTNAYNIRYWGTTKGLGELALEGPTEKTKLDFTGVILLPKKAQIAFILSEKSKWKF